MAAEPSGPLPHALYYYPHTLCLAIVTVSVVSSIVVYAYIHVVQKYNDHCLKLCPTVCLLSVNVHECVCVFVCY